MRRRHLSGPVLLVVLHSGPPSPPLEARGDLTAGTVGDILALRAQVRGAAGIVTDGAIRDGAALARLDIPTYHAAVHPAVLGRRHVPWESGGTVACAGVTVQPGDIIVGDADGVLVLPPALAAEVLADAREQERQEEFIACRVAAGEPVEGLFPLSESRRPDYETWLGQQEAENHVGAGWTIEPHATGSMVHPAHKGAVDRGTAEISDAVGTEVTAPAVTAPAVTAPAAVRPGQPDLRP